MHYNNILESTQENSYPHNLQENKHKYIIKIHN